MGAWGQGPFENDDAADMLGQLDGEDPSVWPSVLMSALDRTRAGGYLQADDGAPAVAAAYIVACACDRSVALPRDAEDLDMFPGLQPDQELVAAALAAVNRALGPDSEWAALWSYDAGSMPEEFASTAEKIIAALERFTAA